MEKEKKNGRRDVKTIRKRLESGRFTAAARGMKDVYTTTILSDHPLTANNYNNNNNNSRCVESVRPSVQQLPPKKFPSRLLNITGGP